VSHERANQNGAVGETTIALKAALALALLLNAVWVGLLGYRLATLF
jgi:hypothetical protein